MQFADALTFDAKLKSSDGFVRVRAKSARAGVYDYLGSEVDPTGEHFKPDEIVKVFRPADQVFDRNSLASFVGKPITNDHPSEAVTADNWKRYAKGAVMGAVKDGEYVGFDLAFMDAGIIADLESGKRELSNGYSCSLTIGDGVAPDGTKYQAAQTSIKGNHVALVDRGRAGPDCRVADQQNRFAVCDANLDAVCVLTEKNTMKKITLDGGLLLDLGDADAVAAAISKFQVDMAASAKALADATTAHDKAMAAKDAEIDDLKTKVIDQSKIDALADAKADVVSKGRTILGDKMPETAGKSIADVRRAVVAAKLGDAVVTDKSDDYVEGRFIALTADAKPVDPLRAVVRDGVKAHLDTASIRDAARASRNLAA